MQRSGKFQRSSTSAATVTLPTERPALPLAGLAWKTGLPASRLLEPRSAERFTVCMADSFCSMNSKGLPRMRSDLCLEEDPP